MRNTLWSVIGILIGCALVLMMGCSVYKAASQPGPADLDGIGVGTPRQMVISRIGAPTLSETTPTGDKQDFFEFDSGLHQASKARIILYLAADFFTLTLAEILLWPLEMTVLEKAKCTAVATYDKQQKVETWHVGKKDGTQGC